MSRTISYLYPEKSHTLGRYIIRELKIYRNGEVTRETHWATPNLTTKKEVRKYLFHYRNSTGYRVSMNPETDESLLAEVLKAKAGVVE